MIGDPVNEAARLSEVAKTLPGRVAASGRAVTAADADEVPHWSAGADVLLRGRSELHDDHRARSSGIRAGRIVVTSVGCRP